eukprot:scpid96161/ scgid28158/ 
MMHDLVRAVGGTMAPPRCLSLLQVLVGSTLISACSAAALELESDEEREWIQQKNTIFYYGIGGSHLFNFLFALSFSCCNILAIRSWCFLLPILIWVAGHGAIHWHTEIKPELEYQIAHAVGHLVYFALAVLLRKRCNPNPKEP